MQSYCDCLLKVQSDGRFTETHTHTVCPRVGRETEAEEVEDEEEDEEEGREMLSALSNGDVRAPPRLPPLGRQGDLFFSVGSKVLNIIHSLSRDEIPARLTLPFIQQ